MSDIFSLVKISAEAGNNYDANKIHGYFGSNKNQYLFKL
jgi:hypothetical protein